jgi:2,4-dienoyl-CoA reductase-like NADH-dependent reductase (Old Yellow Enzyme family)
VADDDTPAGYDKSEGMEISHRLKNSRLINFLNVTKGHIETAAGLTDNVTIMGMTRAHMADPHIMRKILESVNMTSGPASARTIALTGFTPLAGPFACTMPR